MVAKKRKSKRQTLQQKYKIVKRTKEHQKKVRKGRLINGTKKSSANDTRIPNEWPYKEDLLKEVQAAKDRMEANKIKQKEKRREEVNKRRNLSVIQNIAPPLVIAEESMEVEDEVSSGAIPKKFQSLGQNSRRAYLSELRKVIEGADVILQVLDARDPEGTRSTAIEDMVLSHYQKKLVLVLNKADLVPHDVLTGWLTVLRKLHPTIPFKCNTQQQKDNLGRSSGKISKQEDATRTTQTVGADELLGLLKNYSRNGDIKTVISVGIVGFPNVGKSSLINSLMRTRAVGVSSTPGFTSSMQEVILDKNIRLLDSPGVVFADGNTNATALRNCVNVETMVDVQTPVTAILERCPQPYLMQLYSIPKFPLNDCTAFLALVARAQGKLKKGGVPNIEAAARAILHDWNDGKIKYYCRPPKQVSGGGAGEKDSVVLGSFSQGLDVDNLGNGDVLVIDRPIVKDLDSGMDIGGQNDTVLDFVAIDDVANAAEVDVQSMLPKPTPAPRGEDMGQLAEKIAAVTDLKAPVTARKLAKKIQKKISKSNRRQNRVDEDVEDQDPVDDTSESVAAYDFETDFSHNSL